MAVVAAFVVNHYVVLRLSVMNQRSLVAKILTKGIKWSHCQIFHVYVC